MKRIVPGDKREPTEQIASKNKQNRKKFEGGEKTLTLLLSFDFAPASAWTRGPIEVQKAVEDRSKHRGYAKGEGTRAQNGKPL